MIMHKTMLSLAALGLSLSACTTMPDSGMGDGRCNAQAAQGLIGERASSGTGQRALDLTGARSLRWGPPGAMFTMDYREDRVNVMYDAGMTITEIRCG